MPSKSPIHNPVTMHWYVSSTNFQFVTERRSLASEKDMTHIFVGKKIKYVMNQLTTTLISLDDKPAVQDYLNFSIGHKTTRIG